MSRPRLWGRLRTPERTLKVVEHSALTDVGMERDGNEDSFLEHSPLFAVADGMGGANAGEVASGITVEVLEQASADEDDMPAALSTAIQQANERIYAMGEEDRTLAGMGCTVTAAWVAGETMTLAHVGDSRAYRLRAGTFEQLTEDHSLVGGLVKLGKLTPQEAEVHPQRSVILRAVGVEATVEIDLDEHAVEDGDIYLLCSDGLSGMVRDQVIQEVLEAEHPLTEAADMLVELANASGGKDNITAVLFRTALA